MKSHSISILHILAILGLSTYAKAAMPPRSLKSLNKDADMIVVGTVSQSSPIKHDETHIITRIIVQIESVEKEAATTPVGTINIRCKALNPNSRIRGSFGFNGNRYVGAKCRFWLKKQKDGQWEPLPPNGIEILEEKIEEVKEEAVTAPKTIETLRVSDQLTGMVALWEQNQQRWLITPINHKCPGSFIPLHPGELRIEVVHSGEVVDDPSEEAAEDPIACNGIEVSTFASSAKEVR